MKSTSVHIHLLTDCPNRQVKSSLLARVKSVIISAQTTLKNALILTFIVQTEVSMWFKKKKKLEAHQQEYPKVAINCDFAHLARVASMSI